MAIDFTIDTLRGLANTNSFKRGQSYFRSGAVSKLQVVDGVVTARVTGSENYRVRLDLTGRRLKTSCTCPYDFDGVCKHVVAAGLALLDHPVLLASAQPPATDELSGAWERLPDARKLAFLRSELERQPALAIRFVALLHSDSETKPTLALHEPKVIAEALAALRFDEDAVPPEEQAAYYEYGDFGGYFDEIISETLEPAATELERLVAKKDLLGALSYWTSINRAIGVLRAPAADEFGYFSTKNYDYGAAMLENWITITATANWPKLLETWSLNPADVKPLTTWLRKELTGAAPAGAPADESWEPLLVALAHHVPIAEKLPGWLQKSWLAPDFRAAVALRAARTCNDDPTWLKLAERDLQHDPAIARELLNFHHKRANEAEHQRVAALVLERWPGQFTSYILQHFSASAAPALRLAALKQHVNYYALDAEILVELRELLPKPELEKLLDQLLKRYGAAAPTTRLIYELWHQTGQHDRLLAAFKKLDLLSYPNVPELMGWLAGRYPHECFEVVSQYLEKGAEGRLYHQRGRVMYEAFAEWLKAANRLSELRESVRTVVSFLKEQFPSLRLLHSTLKSAGLASVLADHLPAELADDLPPEALRKRPGRRPAAKR